MSDGVIQLVLSRRSGLRRLGFTITELLVVIVIALLIVTISIPAFTSLLGSSRRSLAENAVRAALVVARDTAALGDGDTAVFFLDEAPGRTRVVVGRFAGTFEDSDANTSVTGQGFLSRAAPGPAMRDVFVPLEGSRPQTLPVGWAVSGYAVPEQIDFEWYDGESYSAGGTPPNIGGNTLPSMIEQQAYWVAPETDMFDKTTQGPANSQGALSASPMARTPRQTFAIRFESATSDAKVSGNDMLLLDPRPSGLGRAAVTGRVPNELLESVRVDRAVDLFGWARLVINREDLNGDNTINNQDDALRAALVGNFSHDTVLARPVTRLALWRWNELASGVRARRLNRETGTLYAPFDPANPMMREIDFDPMLFGGTKPADLPTLINRWTEGDTDLDGTRDFSQGSSDRPRAAVFFLQPATGELVEMER